MEDTVLLPVTPGYDFLVSRLPSSSSLTELSSSDQNQFFNRINI